MKPMIVSIALALAVVAAGAAAATTHTQNVRVILTAQGPRIGGPTRWRPGAVRIDVTSRLADQEATLLHFRPGYSYADFLADGRKAQGRGAAARAAVADVFAHTVFDGGLDLFRGQSASFTVDLAPGTYYLGEMTNRPRLTAVHVGGTRAPAPRTAAATITATSNGYRVGGRLPSNGTLAFVNASGRPHRLNLIPVRPGTTRAQVVAFIGKHGDSSTAPPPPFALDGPQIGTADLSPGARMQLTYRLPAGTYAAVDFDQDMKTGRPEALEGHAAVLVLR